MYIELFLELYSFGLDRRMGFFSDLTQLLAKFNLGIKCTCANFGWKIITQRPCPLDTIFLWEIVLVTVYLSCQMPFQYQLVLQFYIITTRLFCIYTECLISLRK